MMKLLNIQSISHLELHWKFLSYFLFRHYWHNLFFLAHSANWTTKCLLLFNDRAYLVLFAVSFPLRTMAIMHIDGHARTHPRACANCISGNIQLYYHTHSTLIMSITAIRTVDEWYCWLIWLNANCCGQMLMIIILIFFELTSKSGRVASIRVTVASILSFISQIANLIIW
jgi:hypothetical protein